MKDLETVYEEEMLGRKQIQPVRGPQQSIEKIQGLFGSIELELIKLQSYLREMSTSDNGFEETVNNIIDGLETPRRIFDSTFFNNKNKY